MKFLVQASSRSWVGDIEHCINLLDGHPAVYWTINRIYKSFKSPDVVIVAPEYDMGGELENLKKHFKTLKIQYSYDSDPLKRMIQASNDLSEEDFIVRINGLNFMFDIQAIEEMIKKAKDDQLDCIKMPDDYPVHYVSEIYRRGALLKIDRLLEERSYVENPEIHRIHIRYLMMYKKDFKTAYFIPSYDIEHSINDKYVQNMRQVMEIPRTEILQEKKISFGDQYTLHYELAKRFLDDQKIAKGKILDIACGVGYGSKMFSDYGFEVVGADYDNSVIQQNLENYGGESSLLFQSEDVMDMSFPDNEFDVVLSMETIEHVNPNKMLSESKRVLKENGLLILSTPQNYSGAEPINPLHNYEYSLSEIEEIVSTYFRIVKIIGIKAGKVYFENDPIGANTIIFAKK